MKNRFYSLGYPNRTLCEILDEMRACFKCYNFASMLSLIEEIQIIGNRMEAGLGDKKDMKEMSEHRSKMNSELEQLQKEIDELELKKKFLKVEK